MRRVIDAVFLSLDGIMQAPGGPDEDPSGGFRFGGWWAPYFDEVVGQVMDEVLGRPYDLLLGRKTYEIFAAHWPYQDDEIGRAFGRLTKFVATRSQAEPLPWGPAVRLTDAARDVARLKQEDGPPLLIQGSADLAQTLHAHGLIDEIRLLTAPVLLGKGKRYFTDAVAPTAMTLIDSRTASTGVVITTYVRDGEVQTGSFTQDEPSEAELARRERWRREG